MRWQKIPFFFFSSVRPKLPTKCCLVLPWKYYLMLRGFAPRFQLSQPARITTCLSSWISTSPSHKHTQALLSGGSYPDERHKFLTGVLVGAANRQTVRTLRVWPQVNVNISTLQGGVGVHMNTQWVLEGRWRRHGRKPWPIAAEMEHGWLGWNASHNDEERGMRGALLTTQALPGVSLIKREQSCCDYSNSLGSALINWLLGTCHPFNRNYSAFIEKRGGKKKKTPPGVVWGLTNTSRSKYIKNYRQTQTSRLERCFLVQRF